MPAELSILTRYPCPVEGCKQFFKMKDEFDRHRRMAHGETNTQDIHPVGQRDEQKPGVRINSKGEIASQIHLKAAREQLEEPEEVPCTYSNCPKVFKTQTEMLLHKEQDPQHDYCTKCDEDCKDWDDFVKHKIVSAVHICCPVCGLDFKSVGGMERHVKLSHPRSHNLVCVGCNEVFAKAGGLIGHLERGRCRKWDNQGERMTQEKFMDRVKHKFVIDKILSHDKPEEAFTGSVTQPSRASGDTNTARTSTSNGSRPKTKDISAVDEKDDDGGVSLNTADNAQSNPIASNKPNRGIAAATLGQAESLNTSKAKSGTEVHAYNKQTHSNRSQAMSYATATLRTTNVQKPTNDDDFPRLASNATKAKLEPNWGSHATSTKNQNVWGTYETGSTPNDAVAWPAPATSNFEAGLQSRDGEYAQQHSDSTKNKKTTSGHASEQPDAARRFAEANEARTGKFVNIFSSLFWQPSHPDFSAETFFNAALSLYCCPHSGCDFTTESSNSLSSHLLSDLHSKIDTRCPGCLKVFTNLSALIQHFESPSIKCNIRKTDKYAKYMDKFSGGFIGVQSRLSNGETKPAEPKDSSEGKEIDEYTATRKQIVEHIHRNEPRYEAVKPEGFW